MTPLATSIGVFILSSILFVAWGILTNIERYRMERFVASRLRNHLDECLVIIESGAKERLHRAAKFKIVLSWYYAVHAFLITVMRFLASLYEMIEHIVLTNRNKVKKIRREKKLIEKSYLGSIEEHKKSTALSESEKKKLKEKAIESDRK